MPRKQKKYHYIYKTTNILNDKFYIGMHSTDNLDDGYVGSGKRLWYSINKHGKENHICEILEHFSDRNSLRKREEEIVNVDLLNEELCMNLTKGGRGNWDKCNEVMTKEQRVRIAKMGYVAAGGADWNRTNSKKHQKRLKEDSEYRKWYCGRCKDAATGNTYWKGKKHSEETKQKMSDAKKGKGEGKSNSQYGTYWVSSSAENITKKIDKSKLQEHLNCGWVRGRKIKQ